MTVHVLFWSYFKDIVGTDRLELIVPEGLTLAQLQDRLGATYPRLGALRKSTLASVGVEYQDGAFVLSEGVEVSLFPPVQGG